MTKTETGFQVVSFSPVCTCGHRRVDHFSTDTCSACECSAFVQRPYAIHERGYQHCACRDCFDITFGSPGVFCEECKEAGCPDYQGQKGMSQECQRDDAYDTVSSEDPEGHHWDEARSEFVRDDHRDPEAG